MKNYSSALDQVFKYVHAGIVERRFPPGHSITEPVLAEELGLSRTPVRQALAALVADGLLSKEAGRRGYAVPLLSRDDMLEVFSAREFLEGFLAGRAARFADGDAVERLSALHRRELELAAAGDINGYAAANDEFHMTVAETGRNAYMLKSFRLVYWRSQLYVHALVDFLPPGEGGSASPNEHRRIVEAIASRDEKEAEMAAVEHIRSTRGYRIAFGGREKLLASYLEPENTSKKRRARS